MFDQVIVAAASEEFQLPAFRMLEGHLKLAATVDVPTFREKSALGLGIDISPEALRFSVVDLSDDGFVVKSCDIALRQVPEWSSYLTKSLQAVAGRSPMEVESFLQNSFSLVQVSPLQKTAMALGERIGVRVGNEIGLVIGESPYDLESKKIYCNLAHMSMGASPRVHAILDAEEGGHDKGVNAYASDAYKPLIF